MIYQDRKSVLERALQHHPLAPKPAHSWTHQVCDGGFVHILHWHYYRVVLPLAMLNNGIYVLLQRHPETRRQLIVGEGNVDQEVERVLGAEESLLSLQQIKNR